MTTQHPGAGARHVVAPLFVPALDPRKLEKAWAVAEAVIIDLEDAVADDRKDEARAWLASLPGDRREKTWIRVNAVDTGRAAEDLRAAAPKAGAVVLPKCQSADDIRVALAAIDGAASPPPLIIPILETALGIEAALEIGRAAPDRIARLSFGLGDLSRDLGIPWEPAGPMAEHARCRVAMASRAAGLAPPVDTVEPTVGDDARVAADTARARACGFGGKFCIHPGQLAIVQRGFRPSDAELALERRKVEAFAAALERGSAAVVVEGHFVDYPVAVLAEAVLKRAGQPTGLLSKERS